MVLPWVPPIRVQLTPPSEALLTFAVACGGAPFSAHPPGLIDSPPPLWYVNDHEEAIGQGRAEFVRAGDALRRLDCLQLEWLRATVQGDVLAICSRQFGVLWLMNANRLLPKAASAASGTDCVAMSWGTTARHVRAPRDPHARSHTLTHPRALTRPAFLRSGRACPLARRCWRARSGSPCAGIARATPCSSACARTRAPGTPSGCSAIRSCGCSSGASQGTRRKPCGGPAQRGKLNAPLSEVKISYLS